MNIGRVYLIHAHDGRSIGSRSRECCSCSGAQHLLWSATLALTRPAGEGKMSSRLKESSYQTVERQDLQDKQQYPETPQARETRSSVVGARRAFLWLPFSLFQPC